MIDSQAALDDLVQHLQCETQLAVDCEMDAMYAYRTSICLVQVGWPGGEALIDTMADLDRSGLAELFADPEKVKVFHGGENDIGLMADRWGMSFANIFDTMSASQVLGHQGVGLAAVLERHFEVKISKKYQKADWRVRPLPDDQAEYARLDVRFLLPLRERLLAELEDLDRIEEAESDFRRISAAVIAEKPFDPDSWVRVKGSRDLPADRRGVLAELHRARDAIAQRLDRAPYRVLHDSALIEMVKRLPEDVEQLGRVPRVGRALSRSDQQAMLEAIARGREVGEISLPRGKGRRPWESRVETDFSDTQAACFEALRKWRTRRAKTRGVDVSRVATTALLAAIVRAEPDDLASLADVDGVEPWRVREYGEEIVSVLRDVAS